MKTSIETFHQHNRVEPTQYEAKLSTGKMLYINFRWEQFRVFESQKSTNNFRDAAFPYGILKINKVVAPGSKHLIKGGELNKNYILKQLESAGFDTTKIK